jgi:hypothetical protein
MRLTLEGETLGFVVDDERATYPVTIDPTWTQQAYLQPTTHDQFAWFGRSVAVAGAWMVIGEPGNDSGATGVNGDPANSSANDAGAAYIFMRDGVGGWRQRAFLKASNTKPGAAFGTSVAVAGNTIVVGAPGEESAATGVNGDQTDSGVRSAGAVYVFVMSGPTIAQQAYLKASNTDQDDEFGTSVAIAGDTLVVGAPNEASAATGVNSNQADNSAFGAGAAYVGAAGLPETVKHTWGRPIRFSPGHRGRHRRCGGLGGEQRGDRRERQSGGSERHWCWGGICVCAERDDLDAAGVSEGLQRSGSRLVWVRRGHCGRHHRRGCPSRT